MQLVLILAVLAALAVSENAPHEPVGEGGLRLGVALAGMGLIAAFAAVSSSMVAVGLRLDQQPTLWLTRFERLRVVHTALWLGVSGGILYWLDWPQLVRFNWGLTDAFLADELLILTPIVLPLVLSWAAFYEVEKALQLRGGATRLPRGVGRARYLSFHIRHELGLLLSPLLGLLAIRDGVEWLAPELLASDRSALVFAPSLVLLFVGFPVLLTRIWRTEPLPAGPLRTRLETLSSALNLRARDILVWRTNRRVVNAVVTGVVPRWRYVILTDALLAEFSSAELEAVFAHEVGHIRRKHLWWRLLSLFLPVALFFTWQRFFPTAGETVSVWLSQNGCAGEWQVQLLLGLGLGGYALSIFSGYARLLEHEADLFACQRAGQPLATADFVSALEKLGATSGQPRDKATWLHPSIARRVAFLHHHAQNPAHSAHFQCQMRRLAGLQLSLVLLALLSHWFVIK